jgi:hypothetical protein
MVGRLSKFPLSFIKRQDVKERLPDILIEVIEVYLNLSR